MVAQYSRQVAEGLESMATWVSRRNIDDMVGGIEDFARQRPVAFMSGAMVAGFALARFMKSSSARRSRTGGNYGREYRGASGASGAYGEGMPRRSEYGAASTGSSGSYGQERPERSEHGGSTASPGSPGQGMPTPPAGTSTPPASGGTPPTERYGRSTEGGV